MLIGYIKKIAKWMVICGGSLYFFVKLAYFVKTVRRDKRLPPLAKNWVPFLGHFLSLNSNPYEFVMKESENGKIPITVDLAGKEIVVLPASYINSYYKQDDKSFFLINGLKKAFKLDVIFPHATGSNYDENGNFQHHTVILKKYFNPYIRHFFPYIAKRASKYFRKVFGDSEFVTNVSFSETTTIEEGRNDVFYHAVAHASTQTLVNNEDVLDSDELMTMLLDFSIIVQESIVKGLMVSTVEEMKPQLDALQNQRDILKKYVLPVLRERRQSVENYEGAVRSTSDNATGLMDFLQFMLEDEKTSKMSEEFIIESLEGVIFAAYMTTTAGIKNFILDIAHRKDLLKLLEEERKEALGEERSKLSAEEAHITFEDLKKMPLLESALRESLRIRPTPMGAATRLSFKDVEIVDQNGENPYLIPKDTILMENQDTFHRNDQIYENSSEFHPQRFITTAAIDKIENIEKFHVFGGGRHMCPGRFFAISEIKCIFTVLMMDYNMECDIKSNYKFYLTRPYRDPVPVKFIRKNSVSN